LVAPALLRARHKARHHLPALHAGFRHARYRRARRQDLTTKLVEFAQAIDPFSVSTLWGIGFLCAGFPLRGAVVAPLLLL
jgi:hypothetical protein